MIREFQLTINYWNENKNLAISIGRGREKDTACLLPSKFMIGIQCKRTKSLYLKYIERGKKHTSKATQRNAKQLQREIRIQWHLIFDWIDRRFDKSNAIMSTNRQHQIAYLSSSSSRSRSHLCIVAHVTDLFFVCWICRRNFHFVSRIDVAYSCLIQSLM